MSRGLRVGRVENLKTLTPEKAREIGSRGGKASGRAKQEHKKMSQVYGDFLAEKFSVTLNKKQRSLTGAEFLVEVIKNIMRTGGAPAVTLMKEIREATEGQKVIVNATLPDDVVVFSTKLKSLGGDEKDALLRAVTRVLGGSA